MNKNKILGTLFTGCFMLYGLIGLVPVFAEETCDDICLHVDITVPYEECQALATLYATNGGTTWTHQENWLTSPDVASWYGVVVSSGGTTSHVTDLLLPNNTLGGSLAAEIGQLTYLRRLDLSANNLTALPTTMSALTQLEELILAHNDLVSLPDIFDDLGMLDLLRLEHNNLSSLPTSIGNLYELDLLNVSYNALTSLPTLLGSLDDLDILQVAGNALTSLPDPISDLEQLTLLDIQDNNIVSRPAQMDQLTTLESLQAQHNAFSTVPEELFSLPNIQTISLRNNMITEIPAGLTASSSLQIVDLSENYLHTLPASFANLSDLRHLYLQKNRLSTFPDALFSLSSLEHLNLASNLLSGTIPTSYASLTSLQYLDLSYNKLPATAEGVALIPDALQQWAARDGFVFNGQGQYTDTAPRLFFDAGTPLPNVTTGTIQTEVTLEPAVRLHLDDEQTPTILVGGDNPLCADLAVSLTRQPSGAYTLLIDPQTPGYYAGCTMQLVDQRGDVMNSREIPAFTMVEETPLAFCAREDVTVSADTCLALLQFFTATQGDQWTQNEGWFTNPDVATWHGIVVSGATVSALDFGTGNNLQGVLPDIFTSLPGLTRLLIGGNRLGGNLPTSLKYLENLTDLQIQNNQLSGPLGEIIPFLQNLRTFAAFSNKFSGPITTIFSNLHNLGQLDLRNNTLEGTLPTFAADAPLTYINLSANKFTGSLPASWAGYTTLRYVFVQNNLLQGDLPETWASRTGVHQLDISVNALHRTPDKLAVLSDSLRAWWQTLPIKSRGGQRDMQAPTISIVGEWTTSGDNSFVLPVQIDEDNYAIDALGQGMPVVFGGQCASFTTTDIRVSTGQTTITVTPGSGGIYENCALLILDHGQNYSQAVTVPILGVNLGQQAICLHKELTVPREECLALWDLYTATNGAQWINSYNRRQSPDIDSRFGVETTSLAGQEHIRALLLHRNEITSLQDATAPQAQGNNLQGTLPTSLRNLSYLTHFRADFNLLTGSVRDALVGMNLLETVTLAGNDLTGTLPIHRGGFSALRTIDLTDNMFSGPLPASWKGLHKLETLRLGQNQLVGGVTVSSGDRGALRLVDLSANQFTGTLDPNWSTQLLLEEISLADNAFRGGLPGSWAVLSGLTELTVAGNMLTGPLPVAYRALTEITSFSASGNQLYGDTNTVFPYRTNLKKLDITGNKFTGRVSSAWMQLGSLQEVRFTSNHLDRTSTHEAITTPALASRFAQKDIADLSNQHDTTAPVLSSSTTILSPVTHAQPLQLMWEENSYAINTVGSGLQIAIGGSAPCTTLLLNTGSLGTMTGTTTAWIQPQQAGLHTCWITLTDHAGNVGRLPLTPFLYDPNCGDGTIIPPEQCDEGRFCQDDQGAECTQDISLCPYTCTTTMVDNCTPACKNSVCGDSYVDANGQDNTVGTQDDELCDIGSFCADGRECTSKPSICPGGTGGCMTRFSAGCSPVCAPSSCGDGVIDEDGENNILDDADDEYCDDGNTVAGDGCSSSCKVEYCGDGFLDANGLDQLTKTTDDEECDLGAGNGLRAGQCNQFCNINEQTCKRCYETCQGGTGHHSIYLLIDVSGSMEGNKLQKAKAGAIEFVTRVMSGASVNTGFESKIGLIKFSSNGTIVRQPTTNYQDLISAINTLQAGGSTNIGDALNDAYTYFASQDGGYVKHVVLLSDGLPTIGNGSLTPEEYSLASAQTLKSGGVKIYTIAVEQTEEGIEFMRTISSSTYMNLNRNKTTSQSSTQSSYSASRAIDADRGNYTQTKSNAQAWWHIDLGTGYAVREVKVWNRSNLTNQTSNFYVLGSATPFTSTNLATTLAQSGVIAQYFTGIAQRPTVFEFDNTIRYLRIQLAGTNRLQLAEVELFGCTGTKDCDRVFSFEDYTSEAISTLYGHIFGSIHCGCGPYQVCGICGDGVIDPTYGEVCDEGSTCNDGRICSADPAICPTECRPRTSQTCTQLCQLPSCGDGVVQTGNNEQCDDSNQRPGDGCSSECILESCGDGFLDVNGPDQVLGTQDDEHCDDGNTTTGDGCSALCKSEFCGDAHVLGNELCDTGRRCDDGTDCTQNPWVCPGQCTTRFKNGCAPDCTYGVCGDTIVDSDGANNLTGDSDDEQCDPGKFCPNGIPCSHDESLCPGACAVTFTPTCTQYCTMTYCGDGFVDLDGVDDTLETVADNEDCDDGNGVDGDGCGATCLLESDIVCAGADCLVFCGDGEKQLFEACDPTDPSDPGQMNCTDICTLSVCGDGILFSGEQCDSGRRCDDNITSCTHDATVCPQGPVGCRTRYMYGCTTDCRLGCGDGTIQPAGVDGITGNGDDELCDDGNTRDNDACTTTCKRPVCGDGIVTYYAQIPTATGGVDLSIETCDDGNTVDGDECPASCLSTGISLSGQCASSVTPDLFYDVRNLSFADLTQFCDVGIPDGSPVYDEEQKQWTWTCLGIGSGENTACALAAWSCGDGFVDIMEENITGTSISEACDDGNTISGDGCSAMCTFEQPLFFSGNTCASTSYPPIHPEELLPVRREASTVPIYTGICDQAPGNVLFDPASIQCTFVVSRGNPNGYLEQVGSFQAPCIRSFATGQAGSLIADAIADQGGDITAVLGGTYIPTDDTIGRWGWGGDELFGQYRLDLTQVTFPYCARTRTLQAGSHEPIVTKQLLTRTFATPSLCTNSRSYMPGYLMQQEVLFSEQMNTGLDVRMTDLSGNLLYIDDTSYDTTEDLPTYTGPERAYLTDQIIETYRTRATIPYSITTVTDPRAQFSKVPNSHVYVYTEAQDLLLTREQLEYLLLQAKVSHTKTQETPFTLIIPDPRVTLTLVGDIPGKGMYIARKGIHFDAQSCDTNDLVQGIFVTNGSFTTSATKNTSPLATKRCNGGGLTVQGVLIGADISPLGLSRRSSLDMVTNSQYFYSHEDNISLRAHTYYRTCVEVPLLADVYHRTDPLHTYIPDGGPLSGCTLQTVQSYQASYEEAKEQLITYLFAPNGWFDLAVREQTTPRAEAFLALLDDLGDETPLFEGFTTPLKTRFIYNEKTFDIFIPSWKQQQIASKGKMLPAFFGTTVDITDSRMQQDLFARLRRAVGPVADRFATVSHPVQGNPPTLHELLTAVWATGYTTTLLAQADIQTGACQSLFVGSDGVTYPDALTCALTYTPVYQWLIAQSRSGLQLRQHKDDLLLQGAGVQVRSAPSLRQTPAPGARDLLQSMKISF